MNNALPLLVLFLALKAVAQAQGWTIPMRYMVPMTNCWLESAPTPNGPWVNDPNFAVLTNGDWEVHMTKQAEFFRVCGESMQ